MSAQLNGLGQGSSLKQREQREGYLSDLLSAPKVDRSVLAKQPEQIDAIGRCSDQVKALGDVITSFKSQFDGNLLTAISTYVNITLPNKTAEIISKLSDPDYVSDLLQDYGGKNLHVVLFGLGEEKSKKINKFCQLLKAALNKHAYDHIEAK